MATSEKASTENGLKRKQEEEEYQDGSSVKKTKAESSKTSNSQQPREDRKRKVALLISYNGKGYHGIQVNPGFATIESELCRALLEVGLIPQQHHDCMQKMSFQRAARTDKGVSAAGNVVSLKMLLNVENLLEKVNEKLPAQIRVMDYVRTTNGFNCKNHCDARTYIYVLPTYAFSPMDQEVSLEYRVTQEIVQKVNTVLQRFLGTHNFHNFTSGIKPTDGAAKRYIMNFECGQPFARDNVEFCVISVKGQSFMLHQIRKMIGLTIAIVRGFCDISAIEQAWKHEKMDVPKAPGLGLILDKLHYQRYNKLFAADGSHKEIEWSHIADKLDKFKEEQIFSEIIKEEIQEKSMMMWLQTLHNHSFTSEEKWPERKKTQANPQTGAGEMTQSIDGSKESIVSDSKENTVEVDTDVTPCKDGDNRSIISNSREEVEKLDAEVTPRKDGNNKSIISDNKEGGETLDADMTISKDEDNQQNVSDNKTESARMDTDLT